MEAYYECCLITIFDRTLRSDEMTAAQVSSADVSTASTVNHRLPRNRVNECPRLEKDAIDDRIQR